MKPKIIKQEYEAVHQQKNTWYNNSMVIWELAKQLQYKYMSMRKILPTGKYSLVRYLLGYNANLINTSVEKYGGFMFGYKFYFDLATWNRTPVFSFDENKRQIQRNDFNENWKNYFAGYDYAIDIDAVDKNPMTAWKEANIIKAFFDEQLIPYSIKFSGSKGFHFYIPDKYLPGRIRKYNLPKACFKVTEWLINRFNLKSIDDSIYDHRRILKLAYSTDGNKVCLPLTDVQFNNFRVEDMSIMNVLKNVRIYNRGILIRTHGLQEDLLKRNVIRLFKQDMSIQVGVE